jgi:hypothetical protein
LEFKVLGEDFVVENNLLRRYPTAQRKLDKRGAALSAETIRIARESAPQGGLVPQTKQNDDLLAAHGLEPGRILRETGYA